MPKMIGSPTAIQAIGNRPKVVEEYVGIVNTGDAKISISHTHSPSGWEDTAQCPDFHQFIVVLKGMLCVEYADGIFEVEARQAIHVSPGEWVRYSTPGEEGAEYTMVCTPAFSRAAIRREK